MSPQEYYNTLHGMIGSSQKRVMLSGLYLGSDRLSSQLVDAMHTRLKSPNAPSVHMLFDRGRAMRPENGKTSVETARPAVEAGAHVHLWETPNAPLFRRMLPIRLRELIGVQHMKVHVADDTILISGANLSRSYFEDRRDRSCLIQDKGLADFFSQVLHYASEASYCVGKDGSQRSPKVDASVMANNMNLLLLQAASVKQEKDSRKTVSIIPTLQLGSRGLRSDEMNALTLMSAQNFSPSAQFRRLVLTSAYFNLTGEIARTIRGLCLLNKDRRPSIDVIVAAPKSNAWWNSSGRHSRYVPGAYSALQARFFESCNQNLRLLEWHRPHWSYHCKGLWLLGDNVATTVVGSANLGHRSVELDLEAQVIMLSEDPEFVNIVNAELQELERESEPFALEHMSQKERHLPLFWKSVLPLIKRYM